MPNTVKYDVKELVNLMEDVNNYIGAYDDGIVKGYIICILQETDSHLLQKNRTLYIEDLCVDKNDRGQKNGKHLYNFAKDVANDLDCYNITLNVCEGNDAKLFMNLWV